MSAFSGPKITVDNLSFAIDGANKKSSLRIKQSSNILVDPNTWTIGTGGFTGYGSNGDATEQLRVVVNDDPWGNSSVVWRTTPDAISGADGGWNTSYYSIDNKFTYRYSVWVRRHTAGTGGTFYFGMNPSPVRNDNSTVQGNPYFCYPAQSSLALNQWYLVVAHCFPQAYRGGRHPDSGWYANGSKISDIAFGNVGSNDVRWNPGTTSAGHRAYHFYTTNTASGLQFAYPRIDLCDGNEPSISELLNGGESIIKNLADESANTMTTENLTTFNYDNFGSIGFNGSNNLVAIPNNTALDTANPSIEVWVKPNALSQNGFWFEKGTVNTQYSLFQEGASICFRTKPAGGYHSLYGSSSVLSTTNWNHVVAVKSDTEKIIYINGVRTYSAAYTDTIVATTGGQSIGVYGGFAGGRGYYYNGSLSIVKTYNRALSAQEVQQNFNALRGRYGI